VGALEHIYKTHRKNKAYFELNNSYYLKLTKAQLEEVGKNIKTCRQQIDFNSELFSKEFDVSMK
jgi:hypothetical protein